MSPSNMLIRPTPSRISCSATLDPFDPLSSFRVQTTTEQSACALLKSSTLRLFSRSEPRGREVAFRYLIGRFCTTGRPHTLCFDQPITDEAILHSATLTLSLC